MTKYLLIALIAAAALAGCVQPYQTELIPDLGLETLEDVLTYVAKHVYYVPDDYVHEYLDEWQEPHQTYIWGTGDCEDHAILVVYLADRIGIDIKAESGRRSGEGHVWVSVDGEHYETVSGRYAPYLPDDFHIYRLTYTAEEVLSLSMQRAVQ